MALVEPVKKGGRYTKKEQEERKLQVHQLHFEEGKSATNIAQQLKVNRNTVNDDIKFWYDQLRKNSCSLDINSKMTKQIQRMEIQRERLLDYSEDSETTNDKIRFEKIILDIDNKLSLFYSKAIFNGKKIFDSSLKLEDIEEGEIRQFVRDLVLGDINSDWENVFDYSLKYKFIQKNKCDASFAEKVFKKMLELGLSLCQKKIEGSDHCDSDIPYFSKKYNLEKFAELREYLSFNEIESLKKQKSTQN